MVQTVCKSYQQADDKSGSYGVNFINPYPPIFLSWKSRLNFTHASYIQVYLSQILSWNQTLWTLIRLLSLNWVNIVLEDKQMTEQATEGINLTQNDSYI